MTGYHDLPAAILLLGIVLVPLFASSLGPVLLDWLQRAARANQTVCDFASSAKDDIRAALGTLNPWRHDR